ncbi:DinB family protein [Alkalihalobacillus sp. MEB130]|uniref:DinB family protein n=1 Tax=Alkalihalobacillus sp. MEB130 TaxID=2976704 RepID=UPI0028DDC6C2|nr:DinB family protein [Alkalihalobacillus sp. MEB130]MDT8861388.1 DinB family protein [Alkalihalobacillus sp. MEB130]
MNFDMNEAIDMLQRTPQTLECFLSNVADGWLKCNEGEDTWNVSEVLSHLIEGERTNWIPRLEWILEKGEQIPFPPFDRFSHLHPKQACTLDQTLLEFKRIREENLTKLTNLIDPNIHLDRKGSHPTFGVVTVRELISTWVAHDLSHIAQIVRVMAKRYKSDVGPWEEYLRILK